MFFHNSNFQVRKYGDFADSVSKILDVTQDELIVAMINSETSNIGFSFLYFYRRIYDLSSDIIQRDKHTVFFTGISNKKKRVNFSKDLFLTKSLFTSELKRLQIFSASKLLLQRNFQRLFITKISELFLILLQNNYVMISSSLSNVCIMLKQ